MDKKTLVWIVVVIALIIIGWFAMRSGDTDSGTGTDNQPGSNILNGENQGLSIDSGTDFNEIDSALNSLG